MSSCHFDRGPGLDSVPDPDSVADPAPAVEAVDRLLPAASALELTEVTLDTDNYTGESLLGAGYAMIDLPITRKLRFIGGARVESSQQEVVTTQVRLLDVCPTLFDLL